MENKRPDVPRYRIIKEGNGNRYRFFCESSGGAVCTTLPVKAEAPDDELMLAWESEGKHHFNKCGKCGKWVCNAMTNADTLQCVNCSPWENPPRFCTFCGKEIVKPSLFCDECGKKLMYGGDADDSAV